MRRYHVLHNEVWNWIWAQKIGDKLWYHFDGEVFCTDFQPKKTRREAHKTTLETGEIKSPMPGKIMKISKSVGQEVREGETVVVMEAMKMEYSLEADVGGLLTDLFVEEGQQISTAGRLLAKIDKKEVSE